MVLKAKVIPALSADERERFWRFVEFEPNSGCWLWSGGQTTVGGYGRVRIRDTIYLPHRVAWSDSGRSLDPTLTLDHLCRTRICVNPAHLEQVPTGVNILRGECRAARNARKTHCPKGHPLTSDNIYMVNGGKSRTCKTCCNDRGKAARRAAKAANFVCV